MVAMGAVIVSRKPGSISTMSTVENEARIEEQDLLIQELRDKIDCLQKHTHRLMGKNKRHMKHELTYLDHLNCRTSVVWSKLTLFPACQILPPKYHNYVKAVDKAVSGAIMNMLTILAGWTPEDYWNIVSVVFSARCGE